MTEKLIGWKVTVKLPEMELNSVFLTILEAHTHTHTHMYIYIYIYILYVCMYVCDNVISASDFFYQMNASTVTPMEKLISNFDLVGISTAYQPLWVI